MFSISIILSDTIVRADNRNNTIILSAELFEQEKSEDYLKTEIQSFELLNIIDIIEIFAEFSRKSESQACLNRSYKTENNTVVFQQEINLFLYLQCRI